MSGVLPVAQAETELQGHDLLRALTRVSRRQTMKHFQRAFSFPCLSYHTSLLHRPDHAPSKKPDTLTDRTVAVCTSPTSISQRIATDMYMGVGMVQTATVLSVNVSFSWWCIHFGLRSHSLSARVPDCLMHDILEIGEQLLESHIPDSRVPLQLHLSDERP